MRDYGGGLIGAATALYGSYDLVDITDNDGMPLSISRRQVSGTHTIVTYFPLNVLGNLLYQLGHQEVLASLKTEGPVNLYLHIPFCLGKCAYCGYVSRKIKPEEDAEQVERYLDALTAEIRMYAGRLEGREIPTIYIGGGTPTVLSVVQLARVIDEVYAAFGLEGKKGKVNLCVEANPLTLLGDDGEKKLEMLASKGVNRLSIGVQSFNPELLKKVGRLTYNFQHVFEAVKKARGKGIKTVNIDLMAGMPGQRLEDVLLDLERVAMLKPESVTWYDMRLGDSRLEVKTGEMPSKRDTLIARIMISEGLKALGYAQTSGYRFCRKGARDVHKDARTKVENNLLGIGVSSYSRFGNMFFRNTTDIDEYIDAAKAGKLPAKTGRQYSPEEAEVAKIVTGLKDGLEFTAAGKKALFNKWGFWVAPHTPEYWLHDFLDRFGYKKSIPRLIKQGALEFDGNVLRFTARGRLFENEICRSLFSPQMDGLAGGWRNIAFLARASLWFRPIGQSLYPMKA